MNQTANRNSAGTRPSGFQILVSFLLGVWMCLAILFTYQKPTLDVYEDSGHALAHSIALAAKLLNGHGIVAALLSFFFMYFVYKTLRRYPGFRVPLFIVSLIFGILNQLSLSLYYTDQFTFWTKGTTLYTIFIMAGQALIFYFLSLWFLQFLLPALVENKRGCRLKWHFIPTALIIFCCWLPWIIAYYPASMDNDVFYQLGTTLGYMPRSNHHPWFASLVLAHFYKTGHALGSDNLGIFLFVLIRDICLAMIFASVVMLLKESGAREEVLVLSLAFYAVTPVFGAYAKHAFKDTLAGGLFTLFILCLIRSIRAVQEKEDSLRYYIFLGISALLCALFRNNFVYALLPALLFFVCYAIKKSRKWFAILPLALTLLFYPYMGYAYHVEGVQKTEPVEALSLPLQQTARVIRDDKLSPSEEKQLEKYFNLSQVRNEYDPILSDPVKYHAGIKTEEDAAAYLSLWAKMLPFHYKSYVKAGIAQTSGYYAFVPRRSYREGNWNANMTVFNWIGSHRTFVVDHFDFHYISELSALRDVLDKWVYLWDKIPVLSLTDVIALYTWSLVLLAMDCIRSKKMAFLIPFAAVFLLILSCIASPVNDCFRYFFPAAASCPAFFGLALPFKES